MIHFINYESLLVRVFIGIFKTFSTVKSCYSFSIIFSQLQFNYLTNIYSIKNIKFNKNFNGKVMNYQEKKTKQFLNCNGYEKF